MVKSVGIWIVGVVVAGEDASANIDNRAADLCASGDTKCNERLQGLFDMFDNNDNRRGNQHGGFGSQGNNHNNRYGFMNAPFDPNTQGGNKEAQSSSMEKDAKNEGSTDGKAEGKNEWVSTAEYPMYAQGAAEGMYADGSWPPMQFTGAWPSYPQFTGARDWMGFPHQFTGTKDFPWAHFTGAKDSSGGIPFPMFNGAKDSTTPPFSVQFSEAKSNPLWGPAPRFTGVKDPWYGTDPFSFVKGLSGVNAPQMGNDPFVVYPWLPEPYYGMSPIMYGRNMPGWFMDAMMTPPPRSMNGMPWTSDEDMKGEFLNRPSRRMLFDEAQLMRNKGMYGGGSMGGMPIGSSPIGGIGGIGNIGGIGGNPPGSYIGGSTGGRYGGGSMDRSYERGRFEGPGYNQGGYKSHGGLDRYGPYSGY